MHINIIKFKMFEKTSSSQDTEPQILFIERCFDMLKDGGMLAIVLPETYFHGIRARLRFRIYSKEG